MTRKNSILLTKSGGNMENKHYFIKRMNEKVLWSYKPSTYQRVLYVFSTIWFVPLPLILIGLILCIFKLASWYILFLFAGLGLLSYLVAFIAAFSNKDLEYILTNKSIIKLTGNSYSKIEYKNLKDIKVKNSFFNKKNGNVYFILSEKKRHNNNFNGIVNIDQEYKKIISIILDNSGYNL